MSQFDPSPAPEPQPSGKSRVIKIVAIVAGLILLVSGIAYAVSRGQGGETATTPAPATTSQAPTSDSPAPTTPSETAAPAPAPTTPAAPPAATGCTTHEGLMHEPKRFKVDARGIDSKMMTVGKDSDGNPGAPPPSDSQGTAWYNGSPEVGSDKGNTILTIHTYSPKNGSNALGNKLYSDANGLKPGDVIRIVDSEGKQTCYRYTGNKKVWVSSYDPDSGVFHNLTGPPQLAIMICWDHNAKTNDWDSRIIFYASLIPQGQG